MIVFPNAKINIGLRIVARRADGYHDIETIFYPVQLHDALEFIRGERDELVVTGYETGSAGEDNLVMKALKKLREKHQFPFIKIHLHKAIPAGAGLGGGSADASYLLKSVNKFFSLGVSDAELKIIALELGSDCPFFIDDVPAYATGRGEVLKHITPFLSGYYIVLMNPGLHISTREAYANCVASQPHSTLSDLVLIPPDKWRNQVINDFENFAFGKFPLIGELKEVLYRSGAVFSLMSGSGSTVFGLFREKPSIPGEYSRFVIYNGQA